jgi:hypothetical protein
MAVYYLNGTTLSNSTAIYADVELTICESDGFYSDGVIVRQLVNCVLLNVQGCPTCSNPPSEEVYVSTVRADCTDFCPGDSPNYLISQPITSVHNWVDLTLGDYLPLEYNGWYATSFESTDTATGEFKQINILNYIITDILECNAQNQCVPR